MQFLTELGQPVAAPMRIDQTPPKARRKLRDPTLHGGLAHPQRFGGCLHAGPGESQTLSHDEQVVLGIALSHKPAATSGRVIALEDTPKLPLDITEAF